MSQKKINIAVIGFGHLGKWHYEKSLKFPHVNVVAVVENNYLVASKIKELYPNQAVVSNLEEIIPQIDAAIVVTPTSGHYQLVKKLISEKKHVFCEKPLTTNYLNSKELHQLSLTQEVVLQVGHSERFHCAWEKINRGPEVKFLKNCQLASFIRQAPFKGRAFDVDVVQDLMIHDLDLVNYLFNDSPVKLKAMGSKICSDHYDHVEVFMDLESGRQVHLSAARNFAIEKRFAYFSGPSGCLEVDLMKNEYLFANPAETPTQIYNLEKKDHLMIEQEYFFKSILENTEPVVNSYQGMKVNYLIDQVIESLSSKTEISLIKL